MSLPTMLRARDVLGPGSALARALSGWERRDGQLAMADAVEGALEQERHLLVEAGTGTGKTLAYLVPAVLSGRKVIVSTATKALQEQIFFKDIPLVAEALGAHGVHFRAALMKGLSNYLCLRRLSEARASGARGLDPDFDRIVEWARETETGDRAELAMLAEEAPAWRDVASSSETRIGVGCEHFEACFVTRMRREAEAANVVVVNHHLLLADLALRTGPRGGHASVLPAYDALIFDEAHQIEDIATDFFGVRVSSARVDSLARDAERTLAAAGALEALASGPVHATLEGIGVAARDFFARLVAAGAGRDSRRILAPGEVSPAVRAGHEALDLRLEALEAIASARPEEALQSLARRTSDLRGDLRGILADDGGDDDDHAQAPIVRWLDVRTRSVSIGASPVDVGAVLRSKLFDRVPSVICTSATLATSGSFHFAKARLGAPPEASELALPSPFDFASKAALYLPDDLPEPAEPAFDDAAADRIAELVAMTDGGAFVLCTSNRAMASIADRMRSRTRLPLMVQGERPKHLLLSRFRASGHAVLVATMSFWEGVDVPGWSLRLVVLDKIPFAPPTDPVVAARCARLDRQGGNGFTQYSVPSAAMTLKQGFGRLIRSEKDAGVVALLDKRAVRKAYGRALLAGLPPARRVRSLDDLRTFWDEIERNRREIKGIQGNLFFP
jgi:ATP-dependent DNA helicase DinG